ncbi:MAG TPA: macrolide ABC transporter ATP-binding protein, partial [Firmicutes bacterium]|nr:macrolide ABC transporter ATP-binding protein [Bacillota bacterium]
MLELTNIQKKYRIGATELWALKGISLKVAKGEFIAFKGPSGSGKSTLLNIIGMLDTPTNGEYTLDGANILSAHPKKRSEYRAAYLGFIFQN